MPTILSEVPQIVKHPQSGMVELGSDLLLTCEVHGKNLRFRWFKGKTELLDENQPELYIPRAKISDAGRYFCLVSNDKGKMLTGAIVDVVSVLHKNKIR